MASTTRPLNLHQTCSTRPLRSFARPFIGSRAFIVIALSAQPVVYLILSPRLRWRKRSRAAQPHPSGIRASVHLSQQHTCGAPVQAGDHPCMTHASFHDHEPRAATRELHQLAVHQMSNAVQYHE